MINPINILIYALIFIAISIYISNTEDAISRKIRLIYKNIKMKKDIDETQKNKYIQFLQSKIEILETSSIRYSDNEESKLEILSNLGLSFENISIPSFIVNKEDIIIDINQAFYKSFNLTSLYNIVGSSIEEIAPLFNENFNIILHGLEYTKETGENSILELIDYRTNSYPVTFKVYITRFRSFDKDFFFVQISKSAVNIDSSLNTDIGLLQKDKRPIFTVDSNFEIVEKNFAAINYFNDVGIGNIDKKIYQIFPSIKTLSILDFISRMSSIDLKIIGNNTSTNASVVKIENEGGNVYLFTLKN